MQTLWIQQFSLTSLQLTNIVRTPDGCQPRPQVHMGEALCNQSKLCHWTCIGWIYSSVKPQTEAKKKALKGQQLLPRVILTMFDRELQGGYRHGAASVERILQNLSQKRFLLLLLHPRSKVLLLLSAHQLFLTMFGAILMTEVRANQKPLTLIPGPGVVGLWWGQHLLTSSSVSSITLRLTRN